jgi:hypothetical protein
MKLIIAAALIALPLAASAQSYSCSRIGSSLSCSNGVDIYPYSSGGGFSVDNTRQRIHNDLEEQRYQTNRARNRAWEALGCAISGRC